MRASILSVAVVSLAATSFSPGVPAEDGKAYAPGAACSAYGPDTTAAELQFGPSGIYNPGTSIEKVQCSLVRDSDQFYVAETLNVYAQYRVVGATPGRLTCSMFIGSAQHQTEAVFSTTVNGALVSNGNRNSVSLVGGTQQIGYNYPAIALICAISPKTWFSALTQYEYQNTEYVPPS